MIADSILRAAPGEAGRRLAIHAGALELAYATGAPGGEGRLPGPLVVLIHGLGQTIADWPGAFVAGLAARGLGVLRFDNRDAGQSTRFEQHGEPSLMLQTLAGAAGVPAWAPPPYTLAAMANDVLALMDGLGLHRAHVVGVSMGGMIAQRVAAMAPARVRSLICIMSSSGAPGLPPPRADVAAALAGSPTSGLAGMLAFRHLVAAPLTAADSAELTARVTASFAYGAPHGAGALRQYAAILADTGRHRLLAALGVPTLVIHGEDDPLVRPEHGIDLAARIPGAERVLLPRMGHEITAGFAPVLARRVAEHIRAASAS